MSITYPFADMQLKVEYVLLKMPQHSHTVYAVYLCEPILLGTITVENP